MKKEEIPIKTVKENIIEIIKVTNAETEESAYGYEIAEMNADDILVAVTYLKKIEQILVDWYFDLLEECK